VPQESIGIDYKWKLLMAISTVAELIELLQLMPQDAEPRMAYEGTYNDIESVEEINGYVYIGQHEEPPSKPRPEDIPCEGEIRLMSKVSDGDDIFALLRQFKQDYPMLYATLDDIDFDQLSWRVNSAKEVFVVVHRNRA
jgi:hypothetical protein